MKKSIEEIKTDVKKLDSRLDKIDQHLVKYNEQLIYHIKRTDILESEVKPIAKHVTQVNGILKAVAYLATISGVITLVLKFAKLI